MPRTSVLQAEREGLAAIAAAMLNPPKPVADAGLKRRAREAAAKLGHDLGFIRNRGAAGTLSAHCRRCSAGVVLRPDDVVACPATGDFFGGAAVTTRCAGKVGKA